MAFTLPYVISQINVDMVRKYQTEDPKFVKARQKAEDDGLTFDSSDTIWVLFDGLRPDTLFANNMRLNGYDDNNIEDISMAEIATRKRIVDHMRFFRKFVPGFEKAYVSHTGGQIGVRDTRRILGEATLETDSCVNFTKRDDGILRGGGPLDDVSRIKNVEGSDHSVKFLKNDTDWYDMPYGAIVPKGLDNILISGRSFSSSHLAHAGTRGMGTMLGLGQAAGITASFIFKDGIKAKNVDIKMLRQKLVEQGSNLDGIRFEPDYGDEKMYIYDLNYQEAE
jgi:hypothetical protein